jgi:hypothetical protein
MKNKDDVHVYFIGHSHINAIIGAARNVSWPFTHPQHFIHMLEVRNRLGLNTLIEYGPDGISLHPALCESIKSDNNYEGHKLIVSLMGGNSHNILGLMRHPIPFDFVLPQQSDLPLESSAQILPYNFIWDVLHEVALPHLNELIALRSSVEGLIIHLESPPPIGNDVYVQQYLDPYFKEKPQEIAPRILRYKLWRLHSEIVKQVCSKINVTFVPVPTETLDREGFLRSEGYPGNVTHGNEWYGEKVLEQLNNIMVATF